MNARLTALSDPSLAPGEARCPGPSTADIIGAETDQPPAALTEQSYHFLGDSDLPFARYTSRSFFDAEIEKLWSKTWQWACRVEHLQRPGDYFVYDVGPYSAMIVRGADEEIRAFVNSCPHRGMQFFDAGSKGSGKQFFRCPFHPAGIFPM